MGREPWDYFTPYQEDLEKALAELRKQEFLAGRYGLYYVKRDLKELITPEYVEKHYGGSLPWEGLAPWEDGFDEINPSPEELIQEHGSIAAAIEAVRIEREEDGTSSILDMEGFSEHPESFMVCPISHQKLQDWFGTAQPDRTVIENVLLKESDPDVWDEFWDFDRGTGRYIILYDQGQPTEIFWAGYSFD